MGRLVSTAVADEGPRLAMMSAVTFTVWPSPFTSVALAPASGGKGAAGSPCGYVASFRVCCCHSTEDRPHGVIRVVSQVCAPAAAPHTWIHPGGQHDHCGGHRHLPTGQQGSGATACTSSVQHSL